MSKITLTLDVSDIEPFGQSDITGLSRVTLTHPKLDGQLELIGSGGGLRLLLDILSEENKGKKTMASSVDGIMTSITELVSITRAIKDGVKYGPDKAGEKV